MIELVETSQNQSSDLKMLKLKGHFCPGTRPVSTPLEMRNHESGDRNEIHDWNQGALLAKQN